jgi:hypothetical protein
MKGIEIRRKGKIRKMKSLWIIYFRIISKLRLILRANNLKILNYGNTKVY